HELVRPADVRGESGIGQRAQQPIGNRPHREIVAVDDHVLELDAVRVERRDRRRGVGYAVARRRSWIRRRKTPITSRYSASFRTPSSFCVSRLGLSLTSIT